MWGRLLLSLAMMCFFLAFLPSRIVARLFLYLFGALWRGVDLPLPPRLSRTRACARVSCACRRRTDDRAWTAFFRLDVLSSCYYSLHYHPPIPIPGRTDGRRYSASARARMDASVHTHTHTFAYLSLASYRSRVFVFSASVARRCVGARGGSIPA